MVRVSHLCLAVLLAVGWQSASASPLDTAMTIAGAVQFAYDNYKKVQEFAGEKKPEDLEKSAGDIKILEGLDRITDSVIDFKTQLLNKIVQELSTKYSSRMSVMFDSMKRINQQYRIFLDYSYKRSNVSEDKKLEFARVATSTELSELNTYIGRMYESFLDNIPHDQSIVSVLTNETNRDLACSASQSPYQLITDLFDMIATSDYQAVMVKHYGYDIQVKHNSALDYTENKALEEINYRERITAAYNKVKEALKIASRELSHCGLTRAVPKVTYSKLERVFQAHVMDQQEELSNNHVNICPRKCTDFNALWKDAMPRKCSKHCQSEPEEKRCNGKFASCQYVANELTVCLSDSDDRYYDWMSTEVKTKYGLYTDGRCEAGSKKSFKKNTGPLGLSLQPCGYCVCTCLFEDKNVDRYFSLEPAVSDYDANKVITGVRIRLINHVHYIEIKQGVLGPNGTIVKDTNSADWEEAPNKVEDFSNLFEKNTKVYTVKADQKTVFLDDVQTETTGAPQAITGVRFSQIGESLRLEVEVSPFDYATGELNGRAYWKRSGEDLLKNRKKVFLWEASVPLKKGNRETSESGQYVEFQITDMIADLGQNTVPYIDLQGLETRPAVPLAGVGLYLKYGARSGGFLGLRLFQFNDATQS